MIQQLLIRWFMANWYKVLVGLLLTGAVGAVWGSGYKTAWDKAVAQTREVEVASMQRDLDAARIQRADAEAAAKELEQQDAENEKQLQCLRDQLAHRPADAPRGLTQSELDILLGHRKAAAQPGAAKGGAAGPAAVSPVDSGC